MAAEDVPNSDAITDLPQPADPAGHESESLHSLRALRAELDDLRRENAMLSSLARFSDENPNPVLRIAADGALLYANAAARPLLERWGVRAGEAPVEGWPSPLPEALAGGQPPAARSVDVQCDGRIISFHVVSVAEAGYVNLYGRDVTEVREAHARLEHLAQQAQAARDEAQHRTAELDTLFAAMPSGVAVYGPDGRYLKTNEQHLTLFGLTPEYLALPLEERARRRWYTLADGERMTGENSPLSRALRGETVRNELMSMRAQPDAPPVWLTVNAAPLLGPTGEITGAVAAHTDITALKTAQEQLQAASDQLQVRAEQLEASQEQLQDASDELRVRAEQLEASEEEIRAANVQLRVSAEQARAAEEHAQERAAELDAIFDVMPHSLVVYDTDTRIRTSNQAARELLGLTAEYEQTPVDRRMARRIYTGADGQAVVLEQTPMVRALRGEIVREEIMSMRTAPGDAPVWLSTSIAPLRGPGGEITGAVATTTDITALKTAQDRLQAANLELQASAEEMRVAEELAQDRAAELDATFAAMPAGLVIYSARGDIVHLNPRAEALMSALPGYAQALLHTRRRVLRMTGLDGRPVPAKDRPASRALRGETVHDMTVAAWFGPEPTWLSLGAAPIYGAAGQLLGAVASFVDVTALRETQEELEKANAELATQAKQLEAQNRELERLLAEVEEARDEAARRAAELDVVFDAIPDALYIFDMDGRIRRCNRQAEVTYGMTPAYKQTLIDQRLRVRPSVWPDGRPVAPDEVPGIRALRGEVVRNEIMTVQPPGRDAPVWVSTSAAPLRGPGGVIVGSVGATTDITALHDLQEELEAANDQLEYRADQLEAARDEATRRAAELDTVFDAIPDSVYIFGTDSRIRRSNRQAEVTFGMTPAYKQTPIDERLGIRRSTWPDGRPVTPDDVPGIRALRGETVRDVVMAVYMPGRQTPIWASGSAAPLRGPNGEIVGSVGVTTDITALKTAQEELQRVNEQLQQANEELSVSGEELQVQSEELRLHNEELGRLSAQLEAERESLRIILDKMPAGVLVSDVHAMKLVIANQQMARLWRVSVPVGSGIEGYAAFPAFHVDASSPSGVGRPYRAEEWPLARATLCGEVVEGEEIAIVRGDGTRGTMLVSAEPIRDRDGNITGGISVAVDLSERKAMENELRRARDELEAERLRLQTVLEQMPAGLSIAEVPSGKIVLRSEQTHHIFAGRLPEGTALPGYTIARGYHPDGTPYRPEDWPLARALATGEIVQDEEMDIERADGTRGTLVVSAAPIFGAKGDMSAAVCTFLDVTDRKAMENELRRTRDELEARRAWLEYILQKVPVGLSIVEAPSGKVLLRSEQAERIFRGAMPPVDSVAGFAVYHGYFPDASSPSGVGRPYRPEDWPLARAINTGQTVENEEMLLERMDGTRATIATSAAPIQNAEGRITAGVAIFQDLTERKAMEDELAARNAELVRLSGQMEAVVQQMPAGVFIAEAPSGRIVLLNRQAEEILRGPYRPAGGPGEYLQYEGFYPDASSASGRGRPYTAEDLPLARTMLKGERVIDEEIRFVRGDGSEGVMVCNSSPVVDRQGHLMAGVLTFHDITEHKATEEALRRSEERYRTFVEHSSESIWRLELEQPISVDLPEDEQMRRLYERGHVAECNEACALLHGFEHATELLGFRLGQMLPSLSPGNKRFLRGLIRSGYHLGGVESVELGSQGDIRYFLNSLVGIVQDGALVRLWGVQRDISERKMMEDELRRAREQAEDAYRDATQRAAELETVMATIPAGVAIFGPEGQMVQANEFVRSLFALTPDEMDMRPAERMQARRFSSADGRPVSIEQTPLYRALHGESVQNMILGRPMGGEMAWVQVSAAPLRDQAAGGPGSETEREAAESRINGAVLTYADVTELRRTQDRLEGANYELQIRGEELQVQAEELRVQNLELETAREELNSLLSISHHLASELELEPLLALVLNELQKRVGYGTLAVYGLEGEQFTILEYRGPMPRREAIGMTGQVSSSFGLARVVAERAPLVIANVHDGSEVARAWNRAAHPQRKRLMLGTGSLMAVPLIARGRVIGVLGLAHVRPGFYTAEKVQWGMALADAVSVAVDNARAYGQAKALAAIQERQRLARDLHDVVSQTLFSASITADVLPKLYARDPVLGQKLLDDLRRMMRGALAELRALLAELRPQALLEVDLGTLLSQLAEAAAGRSDTSISVAGESVCPVQADVQVALYRIAQEALHNVAKHSKAREATVRLRCSPGPDGKACRVELSIADDGIGFDLEQVPANQFGLSIMHERAAAIDAALDIETAPGYGTTVTVRWPGG